MKNRITVVNSDSHKKHVHVSTGNGNMSILKTTEMMANNTNAVATENNEMPPTIRIYNLAKQLNADAETIVAICKEFGIGNRISALCVLTEHEANRVKNLYSYEKLKYEKQKHEKEQKQLKMQLEKEYERENIQAKENERQRRELENLKYRNRNNTWNG